MVRLEAGLVRQVLVVTLQVRRSRLVLSDRLSYWLLIVVVELTDMIR